MKVLTSTEVFFGSKARRNNEQEKMEKNKNHGSDYHDRAEFRNECMWKKAERL